MEISRKRPPTGETAPAVNKNGQLTSNSEIKPVDTFYLPHKFWLAVICGFVALFVVVDLNYHTFPEPDIGMSSKSDSSTSNRFLEKNTREFLHKICSFGPRHIGSWANEVMVREDLLTRLRDIEAKARDVHKIEYQVQSPSGCFDLDFIGHFTKIGRAHV